MATKWSLNFIKGRTYQTTITLTGVADIATASAWRIDAAFPNEESFLQASTANYLLPGASANQKILAIPASVTATWDCGNGRFDFWVEWPGGVKRPYWTNGSMSVMAPAGEVSA